MTSAAQPSRGLKLGALSVLAYGTGSTAYGVAGAALSTSVVILYLNQVIGIPATWASTAILVSLVLDAIIDPIIGRWSDNTRSPWGRRHPFMYAAALPCALAFYALWHAPTDWPPAAVFAFMLMMLIVVRFCVALYETSSTALAPELAPDYHDRTTLISVRWFFLVFGSGAMTLLLYFVFLRKDATHPLGVLNRAGYSQFGTIAAVVMFAAIMISSLATHRLIPRLTRSPERRVTLRQTFVEIFGTLSNPSLVVLMLSGLVSGVASGVSATLSPYLNLHFWGLSPQVAGLLVMVYLPAALVGSLAAPLVSRVLGKKRTMIWLFTASLLSGVVPVALRLVDLMPPNGSPWVLVILVADAFVSGTLGIMGFVIVYSMIADVVEDAAVKTGVRSEGLLFAANGLLPKVTNGIGATIGGLIIDLIGFPTHAQQGTVHGDILRHLAYAALPVSVILNGIAIAVLAFYRIDQATHEANLAKLASQQIPVDVDDVAEMARTAPPIVRTT